MTETIPTKALEVETTNVKPEALNWKHIDVAIERTGKKITLPNEPGPMPIDAAVEALKRLKADEESEIQFQEVIDAYPLDGAVAFVKALQHIHGWASPAPTPGFWGPKPPQMITVDTGPNPEDKVQVPWGGFKIPGVSQPVYTAQVTTSKGPALVIHGVLKKRENATLMEIAKLTREIVQEESIYRGNAIRVPTNNEGEMSFDTPPEFIATAHVKAEELILPSETRAQIETNIFTLIRKTDACRKAGIPLKRGVLLEGPYGCGKSMTALVTAKHAVDSQRWTYIMIDKAAALKQALEFAKRYEPAVIFTEDIDRTTEDRNEPANDLLNILDGILSKHSQIMVVLTTNHVEKINKAMLRPGRLDAVISVQPPDAAAVEQLIHLYARGHLEKSTSLSRIGEKLAGSIPAVIRETIERAKLAMIARGGDKLSEDDLLVAATTMDNHRRLLEVPKPNPVTAAQQIGQGIASLIRDGVGESDKVVKLGKQVEELHANFI